MNIIWKPSPNFFSNTGKKDVVVIHKTLGLMPGTLQWLTTKVSQVSSHFLITKKGVIYQLVKEKDGAWHAGKEQSPSQRWLAFDKSGVNNNRYTIGIEFECLLNETYTQKQFDAGVWLINKLDLPLVTHRDIASYKPDLERELQIIKKRLDALHNSPTPEPKPEPSPDKQRLIIRLKLQILKLQLQILRFLKGRKNIR